MTNDLASIRRFALDYALATAPARDAARTPDELIAAAFKIEAYIVKGRVGVLSDATRAIIANAGASPSAAKTGRTTETFRIGDVNRAADALRASIAAGSRLSWRALAAKIGKPESTVRRFKGFIEGRAATMPSDENAPRKLARFYKGEPIEIDGQPFTITAVFPRERRVQAIPKSGAADVPRAAVDATVSRSDVEGVDAATVAPIAVAPDTSRRPEPEPRASSRDPVGPTQPAPAVETVKQRAPKQPSGLPNRGGVLKASDVEAIRNGWGNGARAADMARVHGVSTVRIYQICKGLSRPDATDAALGRRKMPELVEIATPAVSRETPRPSIRNAMQGLAVPVARVSDGPPGRDDANVLRAAGRRCVWRPQSRTWAVDDREVSTVELRGMAFDVRQAGA